MLVSQLHVSLSLRRNHIIHEHDTQPIHLRLILAHVTLSQSTSWNDHIIFRFIESVACYTLMYPGSVSLSYAWTFCCISLWTEVTSSTRLFQWQCESWLQVGHRDLLLSFSRKCSEQIFWCNQASQKNCNWSWSTQVHTSGSHPANSRPFSWECKVTRYQNR